MILLCVLNLVNFKIYGKVKNTSIVPFTAGSGINYSGEYKCIDRLERIDISSFF
jgi:hypothetical protein